MSAPALLRVHGLGKAYPRSGDPRARFSALLHAIAGIGNPQRFFAHLEALGLQFEAHAFPDHHRYVAADLAFPDADAILMTEKDAVKCAAFAAETHWALRVDAMPESELGELVLRKLKI